MVRRKAVLPEPASPATSMGPGWGSCRFNSTGKPSEAMPMNNASDGIDPIPARTSPRVEAGSTAGSEGGADVSSFSSGNAGRVEEKRRFVVIYLSFYKIEHMFYFTSTFPKAVKSNYLKVSSGRWTRISEARS